MRFGHRPEQCAQFVIPIVPSAEYLEEDIDLAAASDGFGIRQFHRHLLSLIA
jgi:hypothetical protein